MPFVRLPQPKGRATPLAEGFAVGRMGFLRCRWLIGAISGHVPMTAFHPFRRFASEFSIAAVDPKLQFSRRHLKPLSVPALWDHRS